MVDLLNNRGLLAFPGLTQGEVYKYDEASSLQSNGEQNPRHYRTFQSHCDVKPLKCQLRSDIKDFWTHPVSDSSKDTFSPYYSLSSKDLLNSEMALSLYRSPSRPEAEGKRQNFT